MSEKQYLTADQIRNANDVKFEEVDVPEWGGTVMIRTMSGLHFGRIQSRFDHQKGRISNDYTVRYAAYSICDEKGNLLFNENEIHVLGARSTAALQRVVEAAQKLNRDTPKAVEETEGNSDETDTGSSG